MISIDCAHDAWPGSSEHKVAFSLTLDFSTFFIQERNINTKEWETLYRKKLINSNYNNKNNNNNNNNLKNIISITIITIIIIHNAINKSLNYKTN